MWNSDGPRLGWVAEVMVTSPNPIEAPAICLNLFDNLFTFHDVPFVVDKYFIHIVDPLCNIKVCIG